MVGGYTTRLVSYIIACNLWEVHKIKWKLIVAPEKENAHGVFTSLSGPVNVVAVDCGVNSFNCSDVESLFTVYRAFKMLDVSHTVDL